MPAEYIQTQKRLRATFRADIVPHLTHRSPTDLRCQFNDWIDSLHRDGELTDYHVDRISFD